MALSVPIESKRYQAIGWEGHLAYRPELDALRAIAVLCVLAVHCHVPGFAGGFLGVDLFFVLSGYLITTNLLLEHRRDGHIDLVRFYVRRLRRLYPALLLMLGVYVAVAPMVWPGWNHWRDAALTGLYLSDYSFTITGQPKYLSHTWSLAAEEHFYLLWPLVLIAMLDRGSVRKVTGWLLWAAAAAFAWRIANDWAGFYVGFRFDTRLVGLILGCWLAAVTVERQERSTDVPKALVGLLGAVVAVALMLLCETDLGHWISLTSVFNLAAVALIYGASALPLRSHLLAYLGKLSYGIYLWHFPLAVSMDAPWEIELAIVLPGSVVLAAISYHTVEALFRRKVCNTTV